MDILSLAKDIGDQHYAALKAEPPPLPVKHEPPLMRLRDLLMGCSMHPTRFRDAMGCVMEIEAEAYIRGVKDAKIPVDSDAVRGGEESSW